MFMLLETVSSNPNSTEDEQVAFILHIERLLKEFSHETAFEDFAPAVPPGTQERGN